MSYNLYGNRWVLDSDIERAIEILWINNEYNRGKEALSYLFGAAKEEHNDAYYFIARCCLGDDYVDSRCGYEFNRILGEKYLDRSLLKGSAFGIVGSLRVKDYLPPYGKYIHDNKKFSSITDAWKQIFEYAEKGHLFSKKMIADSIYYCDIVKILGYDINDNTTIDKLEKLKRVATEYYQEILSYGCNMVSRQNYEKLVSSSNNIRNYTNNYQQNYQMNYNQGMNNYWY